MLLEEEGSLRSKQRGCNCIGPLTVVLVVFDSCSEYEPVMDKLCLMGKLLPSLIPEEPILGPRRTCEVRVDPRALLRIDPGSESSLLAFVPWEAERVVVLGATGFGLSNTRKEVLVVIEGADVDAGNEDGDEFSGDDSDELELVVVEIVSVAET